MRGKIIKNLTSELIKLHSKDIQYRCKYCKRKLEITSISIPSKSKMARAIASALISEKGKKK